MTLYFTKEHEWIAVEGGEATVGITDYAQAQLGDVVFVEAPPAGTEVTKGKEAAVVESVKAASDVYAPVSGTVIEANAALEADPALVNTAPESDGWFFKLTLGDPGELEGLMDETAYKAFRGGAVSQANPASRWNPADYAANAAFVPAMGAPVLALLDPRPGERILDIGCGDGVLTEKLVAAGAIVVGIDASSEMIEAAVARGLDAHVADAQALMFDSMFDAAFSNAALHWMLDASAVAAGVFRALKPGARFVGEMGGAGNVASIWAAVRAELAARGHRVRDQDTHWYPGVADFSAVYAAAGFVDIDAQLIPRPTPLPTGVSGWVRTFRSGLMDAEKISEHEQAQIADGVQKRLEGVLRQPDGTWIADYIRLRFTMRKPA